MLRLERWQVPAHLARHIGGISHVSGTAGPPVDFILPDTHAADLAIHLGDPGQIIGPAGAYTQPSRIVVGALSHAIEIRHGARMDTVFVSMPPGCACVLNMPAAALRDVVAPLDRLAPALDAGIRRWADAFRSGRAGARALLEVLSEHVRVRCDPVVREIAAELEDASSCLVTSLATEHGLSRRQVDRRFQHALGRTPREFRRIARFARAWRIAGRERVESWAALAATAGYFDQAHLNHDFRSLANGTPRSVFPEAWYTAFEPGLDALS